ncbi:Cof-type HAD-IIB family hydrolase [Lactobacillus sp. PSON]|uniref:Cof-type HAD-IIB family hydrolase n=1 Tax=Lactobacillus sp. PSON TaxID=3455454 RepID=UPI00404181AA
MTRRLIFSDIDGTLLNSNLIVSKETRDAIRRQIIKGNPFIPVSARNIKAIKTATDSVATILPMVSLGGALVVDEVGQVLISKFMKTAIAVEICNYIDQKQSNCVWNVYSGYDWFVNDKNNPLVKAESETVQVQPLESNLSELKNLKGVHKILVMGKAEELAVIQDELIQKYPKLYFVKSAPHLLEIMLKGVNKGEGVKAICQEFDISLRDAWAFGDNFNDEDMLNVVGHPVLMGNAPKDLKRKFSTVTLDNDHDGIAKILNELN